MAIIHNFNNQNGAVYNDGSTIINAPQTNIQNNTENVITQPQEQQQTAEKAQIMVNYDNILKVDLYRIINAMHECGFFKTASGISPNKIDVFLAFGKMLGEDYSKYYKNLSASKNVNNESDATSNIFDIMKKAAKKYVDDLKKTKK